MSIAVPFSMRSNTVNRWRIMIAALASGLMLGCSAVENDSNISAVTDVVSLPMIFVEDNQFSASAVVVDKAVFCDDRLVLRVDFESKTAPVPATIIIKLLKENPTRKTVDIVQNRSANVKIVGKKGFAVREFEIPSKPGVYQIEIFRPTFHANEVSKSIRFVLTVKPKR